MAFGIKVEGGTRAGWRRVKKRPKNPWFCQKCQIYRAPYWTRCPECGNPRNN